MQSFIILKTLHIQVETTRVVGGLARAGTARVTYWRFISFFFFFLVVSCYMILRDLRIHALVSEHLSMWSLLLQTLHILAEKELHQSAQLGVLDESADSVCR